MKYTSQHCCDKLIKGKISSYRECFFPNCTKSRWIKLFSYVLGGAIGAIAPPPLYPPQCWANRLVVNYTKKCWLVRLSWNSLSLLQRFSICLAVAFIRSNSNKNSTCAAFRCTWHELCHWLSCTSWVGCSWLFSLRHFGHLSHNSIKTCRNSIHRALWPNWFFLDDWMLNRDFLVDWPGQTGPVVCVSIKPNILSNRLRSGIKQDVSMTCVKIVLVRLFNKIVGLDLAPFIEKVENHWLTLLAITSQYSH